MNKNIFWMDFLRAIAILCVLMIHSSLFIVYNQNIPLQERMTGILFDTLGRCGVPFFFMLTGCLLLRKTGSITDFIKKRFSKILVPLLVWSIFYMFWKIYFNNEILSIPKSLFSILYQPMYYHLWFLYAILGIYLCLPLLRILIQNSSNQQIQYFLILWILAASLIPCAENIFKISFIFDLKTVAGYSGFLVLGNYLMFKSIKPKYYFLICLLAFVFIILTSLLTIIFTLRNSGALFESFWTPLAPNIILLSGFLFLIFKRIGESRALSSNRLIFTITQNLSQHSFSIYLIHVAVIGVCTKKNSVFFNFLLSFHPIVAIPILLVVVLLVSFIVSLLLKRIPVIKNCVP